VLLGETRKMVATAEFGGLYARWYSRGG